MTPRTSNLSNLSWRPTSDFYKDLGLYMGVQGDGVSQVQSGNFTGGTSTDNSDISVSRVYYPGAVAPDTNYLNGSTYSAIWQVDFSNLHYLVNAGDVIEFGVRGDSVAGNSNYFFLHASNAALSGTPQQGSDGKFLTFDLNSLAAGGTAQDSNAPNFWDKSSDVNVQVFGSAVPEPASMISAGLGALILGGLGLARRRRAQG